MDQPEKEPKPNMTRVLSTYPPQLYAELKAEADQLGIPLTEHLRNIAREHVERKKRDRPPFP